MSRATHLAIIVVNAITIGIQTMSLSDRAAQALQIFDNLCLTIYIVEAALKIFARRSVYFRDGWNIFDFVVIAVCCIPADIVPFPAQVVRILRVLRVFRVFRVFRIISAFKQMRIIIEAIFKGTCPIVALGKVSDSA